MRREGSSSPKSGRSSSSSADNAPTSSTSTASAPEQEVFAIRNPNDMPLSEFIPKQMAKISMYVQRLSQPPGAQIPLPAAAAAAPTQMISEEEEEEEEDGGDDDDEGDARGTDEDTSAMRRESSGEEEMYHKKPKQAPQPPQHSMHHQHQTTAPPTIPNRPPLPPHPMLQMKKDAHHFPHQQQQQQQQHQAQLPASRAMPRRPPQLQQQQQQPQPRYEGPYYGSCVPPSQHDPQQYYQQLQQQQQVFQQQGPSYYTYYGQGGGASAPTAPSNPPQQQQPYLQYARQAPHMMPQFGAGSYPSASNLQAAFGAAAFQQPGAGQQQQQFASPVSQQQYGDAAAAYAIRHQQQQPSHMQFGKPYQQGAQQQQQYYLPHHRAAAAAAPHQMQFPSRGGMPFMATAPSYEQHAQQQQQQAKRAKPADDGDCSISTWTSSSSPPPLVDAILAGDGEKLRKLLLEVNTGSVLDAIKDDSARTLLMIAAAYGTADSVRMLLTCGANSQLRDSLRGFTAAHWAAKLNKFDNLRLLSSNGSPAQICKTHGDTLLHVACRFGALDCIKGLIEIGGAQLLLVPNADMDTPFDVVTSEHRTAVRMLILDAAPQFQSLILYHAECFLAPESLHAPAKQESADRITSVLHEIESCKESGLLLINEFARCTKDQVLQAHEEDYVKFIYELDAGLKSHHQDEAAAAPSFPLTPRVQRAVLKQPYHCIKADDACKTAFSSTSLAAALRAAGAVTQAVDLVVKESCRNVLCAVRPIGRQAGSRGLVVEDTNQASPAPTCGFSIFNSVVIGTMHALRTTSYLKPVRRVAIIDFDAQPNSGTQDILLKKYQTTPALADQILYFAIHCSNNNPPAAAASASIWEKNIYNVAVDRTPALLRSSFRQQVEEKLLPLVRAFRPDLIMLSAGFGALEGDLESTGGGLQVADYEYITHQVMRVANLCCQGRLVSVLEGGYGKQIESDEIDRTPFAKAVAAHAFALAGLSTRSQG